MYYTVFFGNPFDFEGDIYYNRVMAKKCFRCKRTLPLSSFLWKIRNIRLATYCKDCSRKYIREHYRKNREYYLKKAKKRNMEMRRKAYEYIGSYLKVHSCIDCGENDILVLEFDHRDRTRKDDDVSRIIRASGSLEKLSQEISKCDVRCANCHRRKTEKENNSWKLLKAPVA